ncbi:hypothetical protein F0P96_13910 [Hymenobacter busanensis]|uniref:Uncharacterized protein n=1 Tax=Hymenobacter busanensis TaxID=2607656 RepID=A0A7L5A241_9BACT|nr:hypothetical protein [Hymenobacter busanensis]KAA9331339.1 hypothetical protein F0P96_13910 [Hymenobacter busanensis]QHJ08492.1 hypothetical protein GUY19_14835 [Hymenobacter busanensis]
MRHLFSFALFATLAALAGCGTDPVPSPRLDLISDGNLQTVSRVVQPGDTLTTRAFAETAADAAPLRRFRITVQYGEGENIVPFTYLDSTISGQSFLWNNRFVASTNSGREIWRYEATDAEGRTAARQYRLIVRQPDSLQAVHSYTTLLQPPRTVASRALLVVGIGTPIPAHAADQAGFQQIVDFFYLPNAAGSPTLASPVDTAARRNRILRVGRWATKRATGLKATSLSLNDFNNLTTAGAIEAAVAAAGPLDTRTAPLAKERVVVFRTAEGQPGALYISEVNARTELTLNVKVVR